MKMPKLPRTFHVKAVAVAVVAVGTYFMASRLATTQRASAQVKANPFTAELHAYAYESNAAGELLSKTILARRSDGTTASIMTAGPVEKGWTSRKIQYMDGRYTAIVDLISSVFRNSISQEELVALKTRLANPPHNCLFYTWQHFTGYEDVLGRRLIKVVSETSARLDTRWRDPAFGCEFMQSRIEEKQPDGSWKLIAGTVLVGVRRGEPDERMFTEAPASYRPALSAKELEERFGAAVEGSLPGVPAQ